MYTYISEKLHTFDILTGWLVFQHRSVLSLRSVTNETVLNIPAKFNWSFLRTANLRVKQSTGVT
jgi:hypothetical protein